MSTLIVFFEKFEHSKEIGPPRRSSTMLEPQALEKQDVKYSTDLSITLLAVQRVKEEKKSFPICS